MNSESVEIRQAAGASVTFVRLGGIAGLVMTALAIVVNFILMGKPPSFDAPMSDIAAYITAEADVLEIGCGLRYMAFFLLPVFAVSLHRFGGGRDGTTQRSWALVGLLGAASIVAIGTVANSMVAVAIWRADTLAEQSQLLTALWSISNVLFNAVLVAWAILIVGFSVAGRVSGVVPAWLAGLGFAGAAAGLLTGLGIVASVTRGWAEAPSFAGFILVNIWVIAISVHMLAAAIVRRQGGSVV